MLHRSKSTISKLKYIFRIPSLVSPSEDKDHKVCCTTRTQQGLSAIRSWPWQEQTETLIILKTLAMCSNRSSQPSLKEWEGSIVARPILKKVYWKIPTIMYNHIRVSLMLLSIPCTCFRQPDNTNALHGT